MNWPVMGRGRRRATAAVGVVLAVVCGVLGVSLAPSAMAATTVPTGSLQELTGGLEVNGNWTTAGNGSLTCGLNCAGHTAANNNGYGNVYVDVDSDASTFNSSRANLTIPAGATVAKAWLMWTANGTTSGCIANATSSPRVSQATIEAAAPLLGIDGGTYVNVGAADYLAAAPSSAGTIVNGAVEVTSELSGMAAGTHAITLANLPSSQGTGCTAGWVLHVAYDYGAPVPGNVDSARRKLYTGFGTGTVFNNSMSMTFSGFRTVGTGATLVLSAVDGESSSGDTATLEWAGGGSEALANPIGSTTNVFQSIADGAVPYANPQDTRFRNSSVDTWATESANLPTGSTSATFRFRSTGDGFFPMGVSLAVAVGGLEIRKTAADGNDTQITAAGQTPRFVIEVTNPSAVTISDASMTDARAVRCVNLDNGGAVLTRDANGRFLIGDIAPVTTVRLECTGDPVEDGDSGYTNTASVEGLDPNGDSIGPVTDSSDVKVPHLTLRKSVNRPRVPTGTQVTWTIAVVNDGETDMGNVVVSDEDCTGTLNGPSGPGAGSGVLAVGSTWTYTCSEPARANKTNTATVTGMPRGTFGGEDVTGTSGLTAQGQASVTVSDPTPPSNPGTPRVSTQVTKSVVEPGARVRDRVLVRHLVAPYRGRATASLFGPFTSRAAAVCTPGHLVGKVGFTPRNGVVRTPGVRVREPGYYTWKVQLTADARNHASGHACGLASETLLVRKPVYDPPVVPGGFSGTSVARQVADAVKQVFTGRRQGTRLAYQAIGTGAQVQPVGITGGVADVPADVAKVGWLKRSAAATDKVGTTVIVGHVSDMSDRPGALWRLSTAKPGQVITVATPGGPARRFKVTSTPTYDRAKPLPGSLFTTNGAHRLVVISCTAKVTYANGHWHYTRNQVVIARPIA
jgi:hypothetical protein